MSEEPDEEMKIIITRGKRQPVYVILYLTVLEIFNFLT